MSKRKRILAGDKSLIGAKLHGGGYIAAHQHFVAADNFVDKSKAYKEGLHAHGQLKAIQLAQMALELAALAPTETSTNEHLERMSAHCIKASSAAITTHDKLENALFITNIPAFTACYADRSHPGTQVILKSQANLAGAVLETLEDYASYNQSHRSDSERARTSGILGEAAILLMLQHYASGTIHTPQEQDYTPLPSLYSEKHSLNASARNKNSWDLSVICGPVSDSPQPVEPTYKVQVMHHDAHLKGSYSPDISLVMVAALDHPRKASLSLVAADISTIVLNQHHTETAERLVSRRTDMILDLLDAAA